MDRFVAFVDTPVGFVVFIVGGTLVAIGGAWLAVTLDRPLRAKVAGWFGAKGGTR